jgi:Uma2 family endonuclease
MRLGVFLDDHVLRHGLGHANHDVNVRRPGSGARNFRVPDVVFVSTERQSIIGGKWVEGGPDVVFELRSKGDETYEKLPFYAEVGVDVLVVLKGRTTWLEPYRLVNGAWQPMAPDADGRFLLDRAAVTLRQVSREGRYALEGASTRGDGALVVV